MEDEANKFDPPARIVIGYKTRLVEGADKNLPEFKPPANYKDTGKIAEHLANQRSEFLAVAKDMPYTGTLDEVMLVDPRQEKSVLWKYPTPEDNKPPVAIRVKNYLLKHYPEAWSNDVTRKPTKVVFVGFDIKTFLKILGIECAVPPIAKPCPLNLWYGNSDHRDVTEAVMPKDNCKGMSLPYVLKFWRPNEAEAAKVWDGLLDQWPGPGASATKDAAIACEISRMIGLI